MNQPSFSTERAALPARRVHVVDDDPMVLSAMSRLLKLNNFDVVTHDSASDFLGSFERDEPGCALVDVSMPVMDGLALQDKLLDREGPPLVFLSGMSDVPTCASAMRKGAVHFLQKPAEESELVRVLEDALQRDAERRAVRQFRHDVQQRLDQLTEREAEVLGHVMRGRLNKQVAWDLGIAEKTVKVHRARGMEKMGVRSIAELVRMVDRSGAVLPTAVTTA